MDVFITVFQAVVLETGFFFSMGPEKNSCNFLRGNLSKQPMEYMDENMLLHVPIKTINPFLAVLKIGWDNSLFIFLL